MSDKQKEHFEMSYRTGSDIWTHIPYIPIASALFPDAERDALVLDIGAGRGLWALELVKQGYRVLGIDYVESVVAKANEDLNNKNISDRARFVFGDALDIPFTDTSFDAVTDIGTFQHIGKENWTRYVAEISRVLREGGYYLNVSFSRKTPQFLGWSYLNQNNGGGEFEKFGVKYYFFTEEEIREIFAPNFNMIKQQVEIFDARTDPGERMAMVFSLMQKK